MSGAPHDGREDGTGRIVPGETGLAHTGTIVNDERGDIVIHGWLREEREGGHGDMSITTGSHRGPRREGEGQAMAPSPPISFPPPARGGGASPVHRFGTKEVPAALFVILP